MENDMETGFPQGFSSGLGIGLKDWGLGFGVSFRV